MIYSFQTTRSKRKKLPLVLRFLGINHLQEPVNRQHGLPFFQWFYCATGSGEIIINHKKSVVHKGQGFFIYPNLPHAYRSLTDNWTVHIISFDGPVCMEILKSLGMYESGVYHFSNQSVFLEYVQALMYLKDRTDINLPQEFSKTCYSFLLDLSFCIRRINTSVPIQENRVVNEIISYLEDNYESPITLYDLADHTQLSKEYLCTVFKKKMKQTIMQFLLIIRISRARVFLLQYPEKKIIEIAGMCGFESPSYFGKKFKEIVGCTPEQYRK